MTSEHDNNDQLAAAFAEFRSRAAQTFCATGTDTIYHAAHARTERTRRFSITAALLAAGALLTASMVLQTPPPAGEQEPLASAEAWAPPVPGPWIQVPEFPPPPPATPARPGSFNTTRADLANQVRFLDEQKITQLRNSTIDLPPWPTGAQACPAGTYTFHDGKTPTGATDSIGRPFDYLMLFRASLGIYANLDGAPGDEMVVPLACGFTEVTYQLLVLKDDPKDDLKDDRHGLRGLGYIPALPAFDRFYPYNKGLVVEVLNHPFDTAAEQRRRYGWDGTRFVLTAGPASLPADLRPDVRRIDLRQSYFRLDQCGGGMLSFLDGVSGTWRFADRDYPGQTHPATRIELGEISLGLLTEPSEFARQGDALVTLVCKPEGRPWETWVVKVSGAKAIPVLKVGDNGATAIVSHRITGGLAEVVVRAQARQQVWRFRSNGQTFTRVPG